MFSIPKLIVLALVIMGVLYGFRVAGSLARRRGKDTTPERRPDAAGRVHECRRKA